MIEAPKRPDPFLDRRQGERLLEAIKKGEPEEGQSQDYLRGFDDAQRWAIMIISAASGIG